MRVLAAIGESDESLFALKRAIQKLFTSLSQSPVLTLVYVQTPLQTFIPVGIPAAGTVYVSPTMIDSLREAQKESAAMIMQRALQLCKDTNVTIDTLVLLGDPKDMICQATEQKGFNLLVMGTRGLGKIKRALLGSVSDYCVHNAKCPILIVKPPQEAQA